MKKYFSSILKNFVLPPETCKCVTDRHWDKRQTDDTLYQRLDFNGQPKTKRRRKKTDVYVSLQGCRQE